MKHFSAGMTSNRSFEIERGLTVKKYKVELLLASDIQYVVNKVRKNLQRLKLR